jgi:hypothetical protein
MSGIPGTRRRWSVRRKLAKAARAGTGTSLRDYEVHELQAALAAAAIPPGHVVVPIEALEPFANVARRIRENAKDNRWLESVLFYMGDDNDPTKWSLTGRAFDKVREALAASPKSLGGLSDDSVNAGG